MKLKKIKLNNYLIFKKNLELNLTYPKGHSLAGKPLNKVCFLGQSGTGKTAILNLVKYISFEKHINENCLDQKFLNENSVELFYHINNIDFSKIAIGNGNFKYVNQHESSQSDFKLFIEGLLSKDNVCLLNYPFDLIRDLNFDTPISNREFSNIISRIQAPLQKGEPLGELEKNSAVANKIWDFGSINIKALWEVVFNDIKSYREKVIKRKLELFDTIEKRKALDKVVTLQLKKFKAWEKKNPNPVEALALKGLNKFLKEFQLQIETKVDFDKIEDLNFLKVKQIDGKEVPFLFLSTGTKQIILTMLPFYILKPDNAIILHDEPERSLYPDIQFRLIKELTSQYSGCQFFFATHSPVVAATFEPWEVIELKFDPIQAKVYQKLYYDPSKENHIDNYNINPQLLPYGSIYTDIFHLNEDGNEDTRLPKVNELAFLLNDFESIPKSKSNAKKRTAKLTEIKNLANKLNIDIRNFNYAENK